MPTVYVSSEDEAVGAVLGKKVEPLYHIKICVNLCHWSCFSVQQVSSEMSVKKLASQKPHEAGQGGLAWPRGNWLLHSSVQQGTHASVRRTCTCSGCLHHARSLVSLTSFTFAHALSWMLNCALWNLVYFKANLRSQNDKDKLIINKILKGCSRCLWNN